jgi:hypothetical protein
LRQTIRALGWTIAILWIITLLFPVTVALSLMKLSEAKNMGIQEPTTFFSNENFTLSMPFYINNTGFYDLSDIDINIQMGKENKTISAASTHLLNVPAGKKADCSLNFSFSLEELVLKDSELLTNDTELDMNASLHLRVAYAMAFEASMGFTTHWGAPLHNLTIYDVAYNSAAHIFSFSVNFENHASYLINGTLTANLYNSTSALIGSDTQDVNVPSGESFQKSFTIIVDLTKMTPNIVIRLYFVNVQILEMEWTVS